jgi:hypothetical protein
MSLQIGIKNSNKSDVVLKLFKDGVAKYGIPSRVRGDKGGENVQVADFMIEERGENRGSYITGPSKFNTR